MKLTNRFLRLTLTASAVVTVSIPLLNQARNTHGAPSPAAPTPVAPADKPKGVPVATLPNVPADKVVVTIGDHKVTAADFNAYVSLRGAALQAAVVSNPAARRQVGEQMADLALMAEEARRLKLQDVPSVRVYYEELLTNALMMNLGEQTDANLKFFNDNKDYFTEVQARHILIGVAGSPVPGASLSDDKARAKAKEIKEKLDKHPEEFATIARNESEDRSSAPTGGSLDTMSRGQMVPAFEKAAFSLSVNEISQPIKTQYGYHIIQVLRRTTPEYKDVVNRIPQRRMEVLVEQMKKTAKPQLDESFFGPGENPKADTQPADTNKPPGAK